MTVASGLRTVEEFEQFADSPENKERLLELIHGEIVEKVPTEEHGVIAATIAAFLRNYAAPRKLGRVGVEVRHRTPSDKYNARMPDVSFRRTNDPLVKKGAVLQMPDLAVEIQSPDDKEREMREKAHYYLQNGASLVWLVYPQKQTVEVCWLDDKGTMDVTTVDKTGALDGGILLPELTIPVKEIFEVE